MEIRQLEYFVASVEENSFYKASQKLYTSQPAISKAIALLEKDVNAKLFDRTNRGIKLTNRGEKLYYYAKNVLRQVDIMRDTMLEEEEEFIKVASYPSHFIAETLTDFYIKQNEKMQLDYREGTVQDIINFVDSGVSEIGILYISPNQKDALKHIIAHKKLEFIPIKESELCVYVSEKNKLYDSDREISIKELGELKYIRGARDFFSVEHHFDYVSLNDINTSHFDDSVLTNSDHLVSIMLEKSDLCYLGIDTKLNNRKTKVKIASEEKKLILGYIKNKVSTLNPKTIEFIDFLKKQI